MNMMEQVTADLRQQLTAQLLADAEETVLAPLREQLEAKRDDILVQLGTTNGSLVDRVKCRLTAEAVQRSGVLDQFIDEAVDSVEQKLQNLLNK